MLANASSTRPALPISNPASKRQRRGAVDHALPVIDLAPPPQVVPEPATNAEIERNRVAIVSGNATNSSPPQKLSADEREHRARIVNQLAADLIEYKRRLGDGRSNQYGADKRFFEERRPLYGNWLSLVSIKVAALRLRKKTEGYRSARRLLGDSRGSGCNT